MLFIMLKREIIIYKIDKLYDTILYIEISII